MPAARLLPCPARRRLFRSLAPIAQAPARIKAAGAGALRCEFFKQENLNTILSNTIFQVFS
jgi:hypothetical protein